MLWAIKNCVFTTKVSNEKWCKNTKIQKCKNPENLFAKCVTSLKSLVFCNLGHSIWRSDPARFQCSWHIFWCSLSENTHWTGKVLITTSLFLDWVQQGPVASTYHSQRELNFIQIISCPELIGISNSYEYSFIFSIRLSIISVNTSK